MSAPAPLKQRSLTDSEELRHLRAAALLAGTGIPLTPERLGAFAQLHGIAISDFGAHSRGWKRRFAHAALEVDRERRTQAL